uniref:Uncharacterized protein n=1 Tax=Euplotes crassus TaxID=5936 RepID=A0A7S3NR41_EUPCR|mmetsp:Transcript_12398/g.12440  ORF Transcript_12398/g.12440 Transcript_12398/m.12440 type:complete len:117 (+) Transcript_12398:135-485(+)
MIHQKMMTRVEQQIASAKETRFRFLSPGKLVDKLKRSTDRSLIMSFEREIKTPPILKVAQSTTLQNPLNESYNNEATSTVSSNDEQDCIIPKKMEKKNISLRNRRNIMTNQFFRSL